MLRFARVLALALLAAACSSQAATPTTAPTANPTAEPPTVEPTVEQVAPTTESPMMEATPSAEAMAAEADNMDLPAVQTVVLTNASTGETFTLSDFAGKTVLVEPMATWCPNCRTQLGNVMQAKQQLSDDFVFVALSVGENISDSDLAAYADRQGFALVFAIATQEMLQELTDQFGRAALTPPSTPHFIIRPDGSMSQLFTGYEPPDQLVTSLTEASGA
ncbi:MAG: TlpA family protein disulfide reductase [Anaerolineae bacterium]|nr:TlpA family protein disulfide reductase [Anaerolineae bacterium]